MKIYDKNRVCPKCGFDKSSDRWDYYPTNKEYDEDRNLTKYETTPLVRRHCANLDCKHVWDELPQEKK